MLIEEEVEATAAAAQTVMMMDKMPGTSQRSMMSRKCVKKKNHS